MEEPRASPGCACDHEHACDHEVDEFTAIAEKWGYCRVVLRGVR